MKRTKSRESAVDVLPHIKNSVVEAGAGGCVLKADLTHSCAFSLNPGLVAQAAASASGRRIIAEKTVRLMLLNDKMEPFM